MHVPFLKNKILKYVSDLGLKWVKTGSRNQFSELSSFPVNRRLNKLMEHSTVNYYTATGETGLDADWLMFCKGNLTL